MSVLITHETRLMRQMSHYVYHVSLCAKFTHIHTFRKNFAIHSCSIRHWNGPYFGPQISLFHVNMGQMPRNCCIILLTFKYNIIMNSYICFKLPVLDTCSICAKMYYTFKVKTSKYYFSVF